MKIVTIGTNQEDSLEWHIHHTLISMGHQSSLVSLYLGGGLFKKSQLYLQHFNALPNFMERQLFSRICQHDPDMVIVCRRDFPPAVVKKIKKAGIKIIHINPDTVTTLNRQEIFVEAYHSYFVKSDYMLNFMKNHLNLSVHKYLECYNSEHLVSKYTNKKEAESNSTTEVLMYGNYYPYKAKMVEYLAQKGVQLSLYGFKGYYYPKQLEAAFNDQFLKGTDKANKIQSAKIVFNNLLFAEIDSLNCRFFEVLGAGGVQVVNRVKDLEMIYDQKLLAYIAFDTMEEAYQKIKRLLANASLRYEIAEYHQSIAPNFTYKKFLKKVLELT
ncbi:MAG: glycosyltransferase [Bacteroidota bacterium]